MSFMQPSECKTEQQIISKELTVDKKLRLSSNVDRLSGGFKEIIASSIQPIDFDKSEEKLNALNKVLIEQVSYPNNHVFASLLEGIYKDNEKLYKDKDGHSLHGKVVYPELGKWQLLTVGYDPNIKGTTRTTLVFNCLTNGLVGNPNGYCGAAYWNPDTRQVIVVHSGTNSKGGLDADLYGVFLNEHVAQIDSAITFTDEIISVLKEVNREKGSNIQLFITGHSLGAWLAPITAFSAKYLKRKGDYFVANDDFESTGYHSSTVIFDGPGCEEMLRRIQRSLMNCYGPSFINSLDIVNYLSAPNLINACNPQVGEVYRLFISLSPKDMEHLERLKQKNFVGELIESLKKRSIQKHILVHTIATHKIVHIKAVFDPITGEVLEDNGNLRIEKVEDWPLLISGNKKEEVRSKALQGVKWGVKTTEILGMFAAKITGITVHSLPIGLVIDEVEAMYGIYKSAKWYNELMQELHGFLKLADASNNYRLDKGLTCPGAAGREIRYQTKCLSKNYKNKRSLNVFSQPERKFLEEYKFLERYQAELEGIVTLEKLFYSLKDDEELMSHTMEMLKGCTVENGIIDSNNLQQFIPYIKCMLHLFPEMKQKVAEAYQDLPTDIYNKLYQLISSSYLNSIKNTLDVSKDTFGFKVFLEDKSLQILHTVQSCSSLAATRIYKTFSLAKNNYTDEKHHAFLNLDRIFYLGEKIFISFLEKIDYNYLLVIECDDVLNDKIKGFFMKLFETLQNNHNGNAKHLKVVLATEKGSDFSRFIRECVVQNKLKCREENCEVKFNDLTSDFQRKLLEKTVIFQGREVHLSTVINNGLDAIIDSETIVELFKNKKIEIGKSLPRLDETEDYYIDRALVKKVKVDKNILKDESLTDIFAISNIGEEELSQLVNGEMIHSFREDLDKSTSIRFVMLNRDTEENDYKTLCNIYSNYSIHWLKKENNVGLIWQRSHGKTLSGLRKYIENYESNLSENEYSIDRNSIRIIDVDDICKFNEKFIIIAAEPGMGKTTALTRLGTQRTDNSKWFIRINLVGCKDQLEQINFNEVGSIVTFLHGDEDNNNVSNTLTKKLLESRLNNNGNIVLLLDGFDEITCEGQANVVNLLKKLQETPVEKVLISTRLHLRNELESSLSTIAYTFKPFFEEDQKRFLKKFWQKDSATGMYQERLDNYIDKLLTFISKSIGDKERKFMGIPLQMRMIAEAFQEVPKNETFLDHPELSFPENFDILQLYDCFISAKHQIYFSKKGANLSRDEMFLATKGFNEVLMYLAIKNLFPNMEKSFVGNKLPSEEDKQVMNFVGIAQFINGRTIFTHRSFEEYFFAIFLSNMLDGSEQKHEIATEFLAKELFESKNEVIKTFLDYRLAKAEIHVAILKGKLNEAKNMLENRENVCVTDGLGRSSLHYAAQEGYGEIVDILLNEGADIRNPDELGKTALHYAARYNNGEQVVSCLLENAKDCINNKDKNGRTAVNYAAQQGSWDIVYCILKEKGVSFEGLDTEKLLFHYTYEGSLESIENILRKKINITSVKDNHDNTLLHIAAQKGYATIVEFLLQKGAHVAFTNNSGKRPISYAAEKEHWIIVESLLRRNAEFNDLDDKQKFILLTVSSENAHWDIVKLFMEDNGRDNYFNCVDSQHIEELLFYLICSKDLDTKDLDTVEFLIEKGVEINPNKSCRNTIQCAADNGNWNAVELLLRKNANLNDLDNEEKLLLLKHSSKNAHWDIVKLFMEDNDKDYYFSHLSSQHRVELLCYFIHLKNVDKVKFLIKRNAKVNSPDSCNKMPVHYAVENQFWDIVELLLRNNANFNVLENEQKDLILDHFVQNSNWHIVKLFMGVNYIDNYFYRLYKQQKVKLLVYFTCYGNFDLVKLVIERGVQVNIPDRNGKKPINYAAGNGYWDIVELLLRNNAQFDDLENAQKDSLLYYSVKRANWDIVELFMEDDHRDNYFNQLDNQQRMYCLYHFICIGHLRITRFFIEQLMRKEIISSIDVPNNCGETFLHLAAKRGRLNIARYLINEKKADLTITDVDEKSPKDLATEKFHRNVVKFLERTQQEISFDAAEQGNLGLIQTLVNQGVSVSARDNNNRTLLHCAAFNGHLKLVEYLIEKGADVLAKFSDCTVLHYAVISNKGKIMRLVLNKIKERQQNINQHIDAQGVEGDTPLIWAAKYGLVHAAKTLLEYGASIEVKNNKGMRALHFAAKNGHLKVAKLLTEKDANTHTVDNGSKKPIHVAALYSHSNIIELSLSGGVSIDNTDKDGWSPLHYAAYNRKLEIMYFLLSQGANIIASDKNGRTAIDLAIAVEKIEQGQASNEEMDVLSPNSLNPIELDTNNAIDYMKQMYDTGIAVHLDTLKKSCDTANQLYSEGQYKEALKAFKCVFFLQKRADSLGLNHPYTLVTRTNIAVVLSTLCKYEEALGILEEVFDFQRNSKDLGPDHPDTLTTNHSRAEVFYEQGKYEDALRIYEEVLEKRKKTLQANHPDILTTNYHIARVKNQQGKCNEAYKMFSNVFYLQCHILGTDHPYTLKTRYEIAYTLNRLNKWEEAFNINREVREERIKKLGPNHPDTLNSSHAEVVMMQQCDECEETLDILKDISQEQEKILGLNHLNTSATKQSIANILFLQGKNEEALKILHEVYERLKGVLSSHHPYTLRIYNFLEVQESRCNLSVKSETSQCNLSVKSETSQCNLSVKSEMSRCSIQ